MLLHDMETSLNACQSILKCSYCLHIDCDVYNILTIQMFNMDVAKIWYVYTRLVITISEPT